VEYPLLVVVVLDAPAAFGLFLIWFFWIIIKGNTIPWAASFVGAVRRTKACLATLSMIQFPPRLV